MKNAKAPPKPEDYLPWFEDYLRAGNGRGWLQSKPMVFQGKAGYFCVTRARLADGSQQEVIVFCCMPHDDILVTRLPTYPNDKGSTLPVQRNRANK